MDNQYVQTIDEFKSPPSSFELIKRSFDILKIEKNNIIANTLIIIFALLAAFFVAWNRDTVILLASLTKHLMEIQLALFACIFTVFSIIHAFLSDEYMKRLSRIPGDEKTSKLMQVVSYYESVLFLFFLNIAISGIFLFITEIVSPEASLFSDVFWDNVSAGLGILLYFWFCFRMVYEIKSVVYNTTVLFRQSIAYKFIDFAVQDIVEDVGSDLENSE